MNLVGRFLAVLIPVLLPLSGLLWTIDQIQSQTRQQERAEAIETQKRILAGLTRQASVGYFFRESSERIVRALKWDQDPAELIRSLPEQTSTLFLFSEKGKRLSAAGFADDLIAASERCLTLILETARKGEAQLSPRDRKLASSLLGNENAIILLAQRLGHLVSLESLGEEKSAGCFPFRSVSGRAGYVLMLVRHLRTLDISLLERARKKLDSLVGRNYTFGRIDLTEISAGRDTLSLADGIIVPLDQSSGQKVSHDGAESWAWRILQRRHLVYSHTRIPPSLQPLSQRHPTLLAALLAGIGLLLFLLHLLDQRGVSIRVQIIFLFGLSSLAGITALAGFSALYLDHRRSTLLRDHERKMTETLNQWDTTFQLFCGQRDLIYRQAVKEIGRSIASTSALMNITSRIPGVGTKVSLFVFDAEGRELFRRNSTANMNLHDFLGENYEQVMRQTIKHTCDVERYNRLLAKRVEAVEPKSDNAFMDALSREFRNRHGQTRTLAVGAKAQVVFNDFLNDQQNLPVGFVFMIHQNRYLEHEYLRAMQKNPPPWCQAPFPIKVFSVSETGAVHSSISRSLGAAVIEELSDSVTQAQSAQHRFVSLPRDSNRYLLSAIPSQYLSAIRLFMISSLERIEQQSRQLIHAFILFGLCITVFGLSLGLVLSHLLLEPLSRISEGLRHLSAGRFTHRIAICTGDEMEELSSGLNTTLEEMQELAVARNIQEHLLPAAPLTTPEINCFGWTRSQSEIGSEIYDFQTMSDGRIGFWMACVPGHSISSALILAMMKMAGRLLLSGKVEDPRLILNQFLHFVQNTIQVNDAVFLFIGTISPASRQVRLSLNGPFTVVRWSTDSVHPVLLPVPDSGTSDRSPCSDIEFTLSSRDRLITLSPGFLEKSSTQHLTSYLSNLLKTNPGAGTSDLGNLFLANVTESITEAEPMTRTLIAVEVA